MSSSPERWFTTSCVTKVISFARARDAITLNTIKTHQKFILILDCILITQREGGYYHVTLLPLKPLDCVHSVPDKLIRSA